MEKEQNVKAGKLLLNYFTAGRPAALSKVRKDSYYYAYRRQAYLFEGIGIVLVGAAILVNELAHLSMSLPVLLVAGIGCLLLVIGGSSSQPHVMIRSFASLLINEPTTKNAEEFIEALEYVGSVRLTSVHQNTVRSSIVKYASSEEADEQVVERLQKAAEDHIETKRF